MELILQRNYEWASQTCGHFLLQGRLIFTLEDKWRNNTPCLSCIPKGTYECKPHGWEANTRVRFPRVWEVTGVPGRSAILFHQGNTDQDTIGCILVGFGLSSTGLGTAITGGTSVPALDYMRKVIGPNPFTLTIK